MRTSAPNVQAISTLGTEAVVMGFDPTGMAHILRMLSDMYSNPSLAVVREYASNALDSHIEAGNTSPVLITSPSILDPRFIVQDFGTGLSREQVLNVYAMYGASTKRGCQSRLTQCTDGSCDDCQRADTQIGAFGIGAKSAFAVGTQFVVTAVRDGEQTVALFSLNDKGLPTVSIISHTTGSFEPNGVKVEVAVRDVQGVIRAIAHLFPTWERGTVLVDGTEPAHVWDELDRLTGNIYVGWRGQRPGEATEPWTIVMGGVPYALPTAVRSALPPRPHNIIAQVAMSLMKVYVTVPIGAVDITPSREELMVTDKTIATIARVAEEFHSNIAAWITKQIEQSASYIGAMVEFRKMKSKLGSVGSDVLSHVTWRGRALSAKPVQFPLVCSFELVTRGYYGAKNAKKYIGLTLGPASWLNRYVFITDVPERRVRSVQLAAKPYLAEQDRDTGVARVVALTEPIGNYTQDWFDLNDPALIKIPFSKFMEWKPEPQRSPRNEVRYNVHGEADLFTAAELNQEPKVFYLHYDERNIHLCRSYLFEHTAGDHPVVILTAQQKAEALVRRVPKAVPLYPAMKDAAGKLVRRLTAQDEEILLARDVMQVAESTMFRFLIEMGGQITNPVVREAVQTYRDAESTQGRTGHRMGLLRQASEVSGLSLTDRASKDKLEAIAKVASGLPLLYAYLNAYRFSGRSPQGDQHAVQYINSTTL